MGQAKHRASELSAWRNTLSAPETIIADTARALHTKFVKPNGLTGACYRLAFFLTAYLQKEHGITVTPVVGYSNDGTSPIMASHAWIVYDGKKTDISVAITQNRRIFPPGPLLILDHPLQSGTTTYTYHLQPDAAAIEAENEAAANPRFTGLVLHKRQEHERMTAVAKDIKSMLLYLDAAPDGFTYKRIAALLKS